MPRRLLKIVRNSLASKSAAHPVTHVFSAEDIVWVMGSFCALNRKPFDAELLVKQFPPPYTSDSFIHAARALGFKIKRRDCNSAELSKFNLPCLVVLGEATPPKQTSETAVPQTTLQAEAAAQQDKASDQPTIGAAENPDSAETGISEARGPEKIAAEENASKPASARKFRPAIVIKIEQDNVILFEAGSNQPKTMIAADFAARFAGTAFQLALETQGIKDPDGALKDQRQFGFR